LELCSVVAAVFEAQLFLASTVSVDSEAMLLWADMFRGLRMQSFWDGVLLGRKMQPFAECQ
jgi:hypothetical protein